MHHADIHPQPLQQVAVEERREKLHDEKEHHKVIGKADKQTTHAADDILVRTETPRSIAEHQSRHPDAERKQEPDALQERRIGQSPRHAPQYGPGVKGGAHNDQQVCQQCEYRQHQSPPFFVRDLPPLAQCPAQRARYAGTDRNAAAYEKHHHNA